MLLKKLLAAAAMAVALFFFVKEKKDYRVVDLTRWSWQFRELGKGKWLPAKVPGCVHLDLMENGVIDDPYYRDNEEKYQWIGERDWEYRTRFNVDEKLLDFDHLDLVFEGLDTFAEVYLNGKLLLKTDNFFHPWEVSCRDYLKKGSNELRVVFRSAARIARELAEKGSAGSPMPPYAFVRKPAYHFGWDWGPTFITAGIWRPVYIRAWRGQRLLDFQIYQEKVSPEEALLRFSLEVLSDEERKVQVEVSSRAAGEKVKKKVHLKKGVNTVELEMKIENPHLWWTHDLGLPYLYDFTAKLRAGRRVKGIVRKHTGIRILRLVQKRDDRGTTFYFELNGLPIFARGANYIPQDVFVTRPSRSDYESLIRAAAAANMNMLRVWGGGFYERDEFYELCDRYGILVWQDFMFACAQYPGDEDFLKKVEREAVYNIKRLRNHPSLALWCGNNENYIGWKEWGWPRQFPPELREKLWHDYEKLFHELLPSLVSKYDPERPYWPSSPKHGGRYPINTDGDVHYWGVWHGQEPFEAFEEEQNIGRFMSEYGFQATPEFSSIKKFTLPQDWDINSKVMRVHQKHRIGYPVIDKYMKRYFRWPKDFRSYLYVSQVLQAYGIGRAIEAHRRAMPFCMGTLYWQLNDCWPVTSWSSIDYYGRWKALHYHVRKLFAPIILSVHEMEDEVQIYGINELRRDVEAELLVKVMDFEGKVHWQKKLPVKLKAFSSQVLLSAARNELLRSSEPEKILLLAELHSQGDSPARKIHFFVYPGQLKLDRPSIKVEVRPSADGCIVSLRSDRFAPYVFLSLKEGEGFFTDNYFHLLPGEVKEVELITEQPPEAVRENLEIISLVDSYAKGGAPPSASSSPGRKGL